MENATNCVALFYKVVSSIQYFSRKGKFRISGKRNNAQVTQRRSSVSCDFFLNIIIESTNN